MQPRHSECGSLFMHPSLHAGSSLSRYQSLKYRAVLLACAALPLTIHAQVAPEHVSSGVLIGNLLNKRPPVLDHPAYHSGCVTVAVEVDSTGTVTQAVPVGGPADLQQPVADAVLQYKFKPFLRDGIAVPVQSFTHTCLNISGPAPPPGTPVKLSSGVVNAQILTRVMPVYPAAAKQQDISGAVVLHVLIDSQGNVAEATVVSGPEALRESYLAAIRQWKYRPYLLNGTAVPVETTVTIILDFGA